MRSKLMTPRWRRWAGPGVGGALLAGWLAWMPVQAADEAPAAGAAAGGAKVTMEFDNISLGDALRYLALASGLEYKLDDHAVVLYRKGQIEEMETRFYSAPPGVFFGGATRNVGSAGLGPSSSGTTTNSSSSTTNPASHSAPPTVGATMVAANGPPRLSVSLGQVAPPPVAVVQPNGTVVAAPANAGLDPELFRRVAKEAAAFRAPRCISEASFGRMRREPGAVVLDTRPRAAYEQQHLDGAISFDLATLDETALKRLLPDPQQRILLVGEHNFAAPVAPAASTPNIVAYVTLYGYGYRNVFELAPAIVPGRTQLPLLAAVPAAAAP